MDLMVCVCVCVVADINECILFPSVCVEPSKCVNALGSFECRCPLGYQYNRTSRECVGETVTHTFIHYHTIIILETHMNVLLMFLEEHLFIT